MRGWLWAKPLGMVWLAFWLASQKVCADMRYINFVWVLLEAVAQNTRDVQERWPPQRVAQMHACTAWLVQPGWCSFLSCKCESWGGRTPLNVPH